MGSVTTVNDTSKKFLAVKTTGHEKSFVSFHWTAKADGTELPTFIVLKVQNKKLLH